MPLTLSVPSPSILVSPNNHSIYLLIATSFSLPSLPSPISPYYRLIICISTYNHPHPSLSSQPGQPQFMCDLIVLLSRLELGMQLTWQAWLQNVWITNHYLVSGWPVWISAATDRRLCVHFNGWLIQLVGCTLYAKRCTYMYMYVCTYVCPYVHMRVHTHTHTHTHMHAQRVRLSSWHRLVVLTT